MTDHETAKRVIEFAEEVLGYDLQPWQKAVMEGVFNGAEIYLSATHGGWKPAVDNAGAYIVVRDCINGDREAVTNGANLTPRRFGTLARAREEARHLNGGIPRGDRYSNQEGKGL